MKNKFLTLVAVAALFVSCQDAYEVDQPGYQFEESAVYNTPADINRGVSGLYSSLPGESEINFVSYFTDELGVGRDNAGQGINDGSYRFFMNAGNSFAASTWTSYYNIINRCNRLLNRIEELKVINPALESDYNKNRGRILAIRAYSHMKLFAYFTPDYKNPTGLSVIKFDFLQTSDYTRFEKRATVAEIVSFIESDIAEALTYDISYSDGDATLPKVKAYVSTAFAHAVLVKLYAMTGNATGVIEHVDAITTASLGGPIDYVTLFAKDSETPETNSDVISYLLRLPTEGYSVAAAWWAGRVDAQRGSAYMEIGRSLYNELDKLDPASTNQPMSAARADVRFNVTVLGSSAPQANYSSLAADVYRTRDLLFIGKYPGSTQAVLQNNIMLFRYADMLLAKAEAFAMQGNVSGVEGLIKDLRSARNFAGTPASMPTITNVQSAWKAILEERRLEFAFEGHRYLDMKRLGVLAGSPGFVRDAKDCETNGACALEPSSFKLTLPIPRVEIQANPAIASQQNPGY
ncbi:RagB/SusD family nutrient uptake outer membrane protein [Myroides ceti]|uniref:RagB/SusD family nutrient uptake outer membrane protein n=1 Tax=Paenimyroides ceti TaxID=395087 RepID=A0ABT8CYK6_9FLAO|nr:RagB/SusD family nutrient uptake outer membrane protein [Paenimyroides ceti]MDN3708265.1 RagB/SusD family nutrient uptake outer membrane protein [Paenimyroides ceti]